MLRPTRVALSLAAIAAVTIPVAACDTYSAKCDTDNTCTIEIQGDKSQDFPRPYDASEGVDNDGAVPDRIRLLSAKEGGEAKIKAGSTETTCTEGESFTEVDTTITCEVIGDDKVELSSTRQ